MKRGLPCCCGPNCEDTKAFVEAANLLDDKTFVEHCEKQLEFSGLEFQEIDYGYGQKPKLSVGAIVGIAIGGAAGLLLLIILCCCCCG